jgi:hypothetical protein
LWQIVNMSELKEIRNEMLSLHKTLLGIEKENYESEFGKTTPNTLLQLLFDNERFAWLRTISTLIVEIDEMYADKKGIDEALKKELLVQVKLLFDLNSDNFLDFKKKYQANLDTEKTVAEHHEKIIRMLDLN